MIGVCEATQTLSYYPGQSGPTKGNTTTYIEGIDNNSIVILFHIIDVVFGYSITGYAYYGYPNGSHGYLYPGGISYGQPMQQGKKKVNTSIIQILIRYFILNTLGDVIGIIVDMDQHNIKFTRNGADLGVAFEGHPNVSDIYLSIHSIRPLELANPTGGSYLFTCTYSVLSFISIS